MRLPSIHADELSAGAGLEVLIIFQIIFFPFFIDENIILSIKLFKYFWQGVYNRNWNSVVVDYVKIDPSNFFKIFWIKKNLNSHGNTHVRPVHGRYPCNKHQIHVRLDQVNASRLPKSTIDMRHCILFTNPLLLLLDNNGSTKRKTISAALSLYCFPLFS